MARFPSDLSGRAWKRELSALNQLVAYMGHMRVDREKVIEAYDTLASFLEDVGERLSKDDPPMAQRIGDWTEPE